MRQPVLRLQPANPHLSHRIEDFSRKGAKAQSAIAFLNVFFAPLRLCARNTSSSHSTIPTDSTTTDARTRFALSHTAAAAEPRIAELQLGELTGATDDRGQLDVQSATDAHARADCT